MLELDLYIYMYIYIHIFFIFSAFFLFMLAWGEIQGWGDRRWAILMIYTSTSHRDSPLRQGVDESRWHSPEAGAASGWSLETSPPIWPYETLFSTFFPRGFIVVFRDVDDDNDVFLGAHNSRRRKSRMFFGRSKHDLRCEAWNDLHVPSTSNDFWFFWT